MDQGQANCPEVLISQYGPPSPLPTGMQATRFLPTCILWFFSGAAMTASNPAAELGVAWVTGYRVSQAIHALARHRNRLSMDQGQSKPLPPTSQSRPTAIAGALYRMLQYSAAAGVFHEDDEGGSLHTARWNASAGCAERPMACLGRHLSGVLISGRLWSAFLYSGSDRRERHRYQSMRWPLGLPRRTS